MPYFRYFGPTAIVPGLRQMVVKVRGKQHGSAQTTSDRKYILRATDFKLVMRYRGALAPLQRKHSLAALLYSRLM